MPQTHTAESAPLPTSSGEVSGVEQAVGSNRQKEPVTHIGNQALHVPIGGYESMVVPAYSNRHLNELCQDETLVVGITGMLRNGLDYYRDYREALRQSGMTDTMLIVPHILAQYDVHVDGTEQTEPDHTQVFLDAVDINPDFRNEQDEPNLLYWDVAGWKSGLPALNSRLQQPKQAPSWPRPEAPSSFAISDSAITYAAKSRRAHEKLEEVIFIGSSAGAQYYNRYAITHRETEALTYLKSEGVKVRFIVSNPSTYLYLDSERPCPVDSQHSDEVNMWRYGFDKASTLAPYVDKPSEYYINRLQSGAIDLISLVGAADPTQPLGLEDGPAAAAQGLERVSRWTNYQKHLLKHGIGAEQNVRFGLVGDAGHGIAGMLHSTLGRQALADPEHLEHYLVAA